MQRQRLPYLLAPRFAGTRKIGHGALCSRKSRSSRWNAIIRESFCPITAFFFCSDRWYQTRQPQVLLCSLIHQILFAYPDFAEPLKTKFPVIETKTIGSISMLWTILALITSDMRQRSLVIEMDRFRRLKKGILESSVGRASPIFEPQ